MQLVPPTRPPMDPRAPDATANEPTPLHAHASENLAYIREAMARAGIFTAVPGWGNVGVGALALSVAGMMHGPGSGATDVVWVGVWVATAVLGFVTAVGAMAIKVRRAGLSLFVGAGGRFWAAILPGFAAAALLTGPLVRAGATDLLPSLWMLVYGAAVMTAGWHSIRPVPLLGAAVMVCGALATFSPSRDVSMAIGFGAVHVMFGCLIARKYGG